MREPEMRECPVCGTLNDFDKAVYENESTAVCTNCGQKLVATVEDLDTEDGPEYIFYFEKDE